MLHLRRWLAAVLLRSCFERDMSEELTAHLEMRVEALIASGLSTDAARRQARLEFGSVEGYKDRCRDVRRITSLDDLRQDVRYAIRTLRNAPAFTAAAALTLALAIGANTAIFSVVNGVLLRSLPYPHSDRLVRIYSTQVERGGRSSSSIPNYVDWKARTTTIEAMEGFREGRALFDGDLDRPISVVHGGPGLLDLIGARPVVGRLMGREDVRADAPPVALLTYGAWMNHFGGNPEVVGRSIRLGERRVVFPREYDPRVEIDVAVYTVIGVVEPIRGPLFGGVQVILPWIIDTDPNAANRASRILPVIARLHRETTLTQAQAEMDRIGAALREEHRDPQIAMWMPKVVSLHEDTMSMVAGARPALIALLGATGLILLIAISNIANLLLARGSARQAELAVRAALGAGRARLARLLLTESLLLSLLGGLGGLVVGYAGVRVLLSLEPAWIPRLHEVAVDGTVLSMALAVTLAAGLLFGFVPVLFLRGTLMFQSRDAAEPADGRGWLRSGLIMTQLALSLVLLTGAGLMVRSLHALQAVPIGIDYRQIVTFSLGDGGFTVAPSGLDRPATLQQYREILEHVRAIPGVDDVTLTSQAPLQQRGGGMIIELLSGPGAGERQDVGLVAVTENFFSFFGSRVVAGRAFNAADALRADSVVVVDSNLAVILWRGEPAVGQRIALYGIESEVIGVTEPIRYGSLAEDMRPKLFHLQGRSGVFGADVLVRHQGDPAPIIAAIESRLKEVDASLRLTNLQPLEALYNQHLREPRFQTLLLGALGLLALAVATIGVYGVVAYSVARRTGEIGIRMALGAGRGGIIGLFCRRTMVLVAAGLSVGVVGAAWLTRYIEGLLFAIEPTDPVAIASMAAILAVAALAATMIPMRRALRVDPASTLRSE